MKTLFYFRHIQNKYSFGCFYNYVRFSREIYMDLKKLSIVYWYCHFKLAINILLSFSDMVCNFTVYGGMNSNVLSLKNVAKN